MSLCYSIYRCDVRRIELAYTEPYSAYYRYNGQLGLEIYFSSRSTPGKRVNLGAKGIPLFEAKAIIPEYTRHLVKSEFTEIKDIAYLAQEVRTLYEEVADYRLFGHFNEYHLESLIFLDDNERKYHTLKTYEDQCRELQREIRHLETCYSQKNDKVNQLRKEIKQAEIRLRQYREKEEYYKKLEKDNEFLKQERTQLQSERQQLTTQSQYLLKEKDATTEKVEALRNRSFWQRLFNKQ